MITCPQFSQWRKTIYPYLSTRHLNIQAFLTPSAVMTSHVVFVYSWLVVSWTFRFYDTNFLMDKSLIILPILWTLVVCNHLLVAYRGVRTSLHLHHSLSTLHLLASACPCIQPHFPTRSCMARARFVTRSVVITIRSFHSWTKQDTPKG